MKTINTFFCIVFLCCTLHFAHAQDETRIGALLAYGTEVENLGIGANAEFPIMDKLTISPSFIYYLPKDQVGVKVNWFEINGNANYYFLEQDNLSVYGLGGLNYSSVKVKYDGPYGGIIDYGGADGRFGLNIGGGANFILGNLTPFAELKYVIIDGGQLVLAAGVKFGL